MAGRWFGCSCALVMIAAASIGCAQGASETEGVPPLDGLDTGSVDDGGDTSVGGDSSAGDSKADSPGDAPSDGSCDPSKGLTISCGVGECIVTVPACSETGVPATCKPKDPGVEVCDGKDNDCDGLTDEDLGQTECGVGECKQIQKNCVDGVVKTCTPKMPGVEVCDGKDNDCDGNIDNGFPTNTCGVGECKVTVSACSGGMPGVCTPKMPGTEVCNGKDDDCDGMIDDGIADITCGTGICANTVMGCASGMVPSCVPKDLGVESCGIGECANVISKCIGGVPQTCAPKPSSPEICDGRDNDCNGTPDDGPPATMCPPTPGVHVATTKCASSKCGIDTCDPGWADVDADYANGCECQDPVTSNRTCGGATNGGAVVRGTPRTFSQKNPVPGRDDWWSFTLVDARKDKLVTPSITITAPGFTDATIPFLFDVYTGNCATPARNCSDNPADPPTDQTSWSMIYTAGTYGSADGLFPMLGGPGDDAVVFVRVHYRSPTTAAVCVPYTLTVQE